MRNGMTGYVEGAGEVHFQHGVPVCRVEILHWFGRPTNAGVVDQHIEAVEARSRIRNHRRDFFAVTDIAAAGEEARHRVCRAFQAGQIDIADVHPVTAGMKALAMARPMPDAPAVTSTFFMPQV